jgi:diketogulonate reductase-like aldo/keto reductase
MHTRPIPSTGEPLPVVGCGTWRGFDVGAAAADRARLGSVLDTLFAAGGRMLDSSPMYGRAEAVVGDLLGAAAPRPPAFLATKVWTRGREAGIAQMRESLRRLRADRIDLMQVHNLVDWREHWPTLRAWKDAGTVRYAGLTHYDESAYPALEGALRALRPDFVQFNYSVQARTAEARLLPLAAELGVAVIVNLPFGGGDLLRRLARVPVPAWANELGCGGWAPLLLKFVLGHPAVTCAIPGTGRAEHMAANAAAGTGVVLDADQRQRVFTAWQAAAG